MARSSSPEAWGCYAILALTPLAVGFAAARAQSSLGWTILGLCALVLALFAFFSESMRRASDTKGIEGYWGCLPILGLLLGAVGAYASRSQYF